MSTQVFTAGGTFTVPAGVTSLQCEAWGAGGSGVGGINGSRAGGAGGGGEYAAELALPVTPGAALTVTVAAAGSGAVTTVTGAATTVTAHAGGNASGTTGGAAGAGSSNSTHHAGGAGGNGQSGSNHNGGGGGSSGGTSAAGNDGADSTGGGAGGAAPAGGAAGGAGGGGVGAGGAGGAPGGGGGGGGNGFSQNGAAGSGAGGQVTFTWTVPPVTATGGLAMLPMGAAATAGGGSTTCTGGLAMPAMVVGAAADPPTGSGGAAMPAMAMSGEASSHTAFPQIPLGLKVEILANGTWTDITGFVYQRTDLVITRGLPDETQSVTPSQLTLTLNNRDGRFSPKNPLGAYFPFLTRNVQCRVSVDAWTNPTILVDSYADAYADTYGTPESVWINYSGYRFWGEVSTWPPQWDPTGTDVYCNITVSGVLRRYVQGAQLGSPMRRYYSRLTGDFTPYGYWPGEDGQQATEISSAIPAVPSAAFTGTPGFASDRSFGGSDAIPTISGSVWHAQTGAAADPPGTGSITQKSPGTYRWTCPNGVTAVTGVTATGGGGGGGDGSATAVRGGGGGGGGALGLESSVAVTAGRTYTYVVGTGGAAGVAANGSNGATSSFTGDSRTVTGNGGRGGVYGASGGAGGAGGAAGSNTTRHAGGSGGAGSASTTRTDSDALYGTAGGSGGGATGGQASTTWRAPTGITGTVNVTAQGAGGGGAGGASGAAGHGGGGGGGGGFSTGTSSVSAGDTLTFYAGKGGAGGTAAHGGDGGDSKVSDGSVVAGGGQAGSGSGSPGAGGSGTTPGSGGGTGGSPAGSAFGGGGGGGGAGSSPGGGHNGSGRQPGAGGGDGSGGGWGASSSGDLSSCTTGGTGGSYGGGGGGGGAASNTIGKVGGGGGAGYIKWNWQITGAPAGGGGGSSGGTSANGNAGSTSGTGGAAPSGGGAGGNAGSSSPAGLSPGGGGAGGIPDTGKGAVSPGSGSAGSVKFAWNGGTTSPVAGDIVRFCLRVDPAGAADGAVLVRVVTYGTIQNLDLIYHTSGHLELIGYTGSTTYFDSGSISFSADGTPLYVSIELTANGSAANWLLTAIHPGSGTPVASASGTVSAVSVGFVSDVYVNPDSGVADSGTAVGQITAQTYADTLANVATIIAGYAGELAADRVARLAAEQGIGFDLVGFNTDTPQMGPQQDDTFVNVLQSCADLDRGQLFETRDQFGIGYRTRASLQGQDPAVVADYTLATLAGSLQPTADDQFTRNDVTVTRNGGASATIALTTGSMSTAEPPSGVGDYTYSLTVQAFADTQLPNLAAWILTVGTVDEYRYPSVPFDLRRPEVAALFTALATLDIGDYVQVTNPPSFLTDSPISQLAWGFTETLNAYQWTISINTVPESPFSEGNPPTW